MSWHCQELPSPGLETGQGRALPFCPVGTVGFGTCHGLPEVPAGTSATQPPVSLAAGVDTAGRSSAGAAGRCFQPNELWLPSGKRRVLPAWLPLPEAFPLLWGEGGFFVRFPPSPCLQPGLPEMLPGALASPETGSGAVPEGPGHLGLSRPGCFAPGFLAQHPSSFWAAAPLPAYLNFNSSLLLTGSLTPPFPPEKGKLSS